MEKQTFIGEHVYNAPVEKVWKALTDKEEMKHWYFTIPDFELKEGTTFNFYESDKKEYHHRCVIKQIVPNRKFQHTWTHPGHSNGETVLTWELFPAGEKTRLKLTHTGLETLSDGGPAFSKENYKAGWKEILENFLKKYLGNGR